MIDGQTVTYFQQCLFEKSNNFNLFYTKAIKALSLLENKLRWNIKNKSEFIFFELLAKLEKKPLKNFQITLRENDYYIIDLRHTF